MSKSKPKSPIIDKPSKEQIQEFVSRPINMAEGDEVDEKIKKLMEFFDRYGIKFDKFKPINSSVFGDDFFKDKKAYPNYDQYQNIPGKRDIPKWMFALKNIHYKQKAGFDFKEAIRTATQGWQKMEVYDFLNWLKFYEEGANMKYKFAQVWYENGQPGYFLHIKPDAPKEPEPIFDGQAVNDAREEAERNDEKRSIIEKQRQKIIGRLDSAEKLLRSPEGQQFAGNELEQLMEAIYTLKKKVQLVNKLSVSTRLYEDMIVREANVLSRKGFIKAADMLYSVAQTPGASAEGATGQQTGGAIPVTPSPPDPSGAGQSGTMGGLPATVPGTNPQTPSDGGAQNEMPPSANSLLGATPATPNEAPGIAEFKNNFETFDQKSGVDNLEVVDELDVYDAEDDLMVSEAQMAPPTRPGIPPAALEDVPMTDTPTPDRNPPSFIPKINPKEDVPNTKNPVATEEPLEVTEDDIRKPVGQNDENITPSNFDLKVDSVFADLTVADVVAKLEDLAKIFKVREVPRQLAVVDMMLDSLGLASYFPSLSEAQNKALDSNNYISTRVEDILSKLRGAMDTKAIDLKGGPNANNPEVAGIKGNLEESDAKEKQRKQMRKDQAAQELEGGAEKETPEVELGELGAPPTAPVKTPVPRPLG